MGKLRKKGDRGAAVNFISRNNALKKLQLSLPDFRRLCILKGIYPREPNNTKKLKGGPNATYYYAKDIQFLAHEPLLHKFREFKHFMKRMKKAMGKRDEDQQKRLEDSKPQYSVDHLVKERYPAFVDALRDMDDGLCMVFLFRIMPRTTKVKEDVVTACDRLAREFMQYVIKSGSLRKVFLSIKGIYYQAEIMGQTITWIAPYSFNQKVPSDVDFRVMLTFLEFYTTMLGFVNYKLYSDLNLHYPPKLDAVSDARGGSLNALVLESRDGVKNAGMEVDSDGEVADDMSEEALKKQQEESRERVATLQSAIKSIAATAANGDSEEAIAADAAAGGEIGLDSFEAKAPGADQLDGLNEVKRKEDEDRRYKTLFARCKFFLSREVPRESLEFVTKALGGEVSWEQVTETGVTASSYPMSDPSITHHVVDRPKLLSGHHFEGRVYVQPQWVYDCINAQKLLPVEPYAINAILPPHLSPFVEHKAGDYVPGVDAAAEEEEEEEVEAESEDEEATYRRELEAETKGKAFSQATDSGKKSAKKGVKRPAEAEADEDKELAKIMMSKKHKQLYNKIMHGKAQKQAEVAKLEEKRKSIDAQKKSGKNKKQK